MASPNEQLGTLLNRAREVEILLAQVQSQFAEIKSSAGGSVHQHVSEKSKFCIKEKKREEKKNNKLKLYDCVCFTASLSSAVVTGKYMEEKAIPYDILGAYLLALKNAPSNVKFMLIDKTESTYLIAPDRTLCLCLYVLLLLLLLFVFVKKFKKQYFFIKKKKNKSNCVIHRRLEGAVVISRALLRLCGLDSSDAIQASAVDHWLFKFQASGLFENKQTLPKLLEELHKHLQYRTYLVGYNVTSADLELFNKLKHSSWWSKHVPL
ncbi:hypothetical protein RFI_24376, partial [Reticulomyxa filosa]